MSPAEPRRVSAVEVIRGTAAYYNVRVSQLMGPSRSGYIAFARQVAMFLVRADCQLSYPQIGTIFHRDHTTVMAACKRVTEAQADVALGTIREMVVNVGTAPSLESDCANCRRWHGENQTLRQQLADAYRLIDDGGK